MSAASIFPFYPTTKVCFTFWFYLFFFFFWLLFSLTRLLLSLFRLVGLLFNCFNKNVSLDASGANLIECYHMFSVYFSSLFSLSLTLFLYIYLFLLFYSVYLLLFVSFLWNGPQIATVTVITLGLRLLLGTLPIRSPVTTRTVSISSPETTAELYRTCSWLPRESDFLLWRITPTNVLSFLRTTIPI